MNTQNDTTQNEEEVDISFNCFLEAIKKDFQAADKQTKKLVKYVQDDISKALAYGPRGSLVDKPLSNKKSSSQINQLIGTEIIASGFKEMQKKASRDFRFIQMYDKYEVDETIKDISNQKIGKYIDSFSDKVKEDIDDINKQTTITVSNIKAKLDRYMPNVDYSSVKGHEEDVEENFDKLSEIVKNDLVTTKQATDKIVQQLSQDLRETAKRDMVIKKDAAEQTTENVKKDIDGYISVARESLDLATDFQNVNSDMKEKITNIKATVNSYTQSMPKTTFSNPRFKDTNNKIHDHVDFIKQNVNSTFHQIHDEMDITTWKKYNESTTNIRKDIENFQDVAKKHFKFVDEKMHQDVEQFKALPDTQARNCFWEMDQKMQKDVANVKAAVSEVPKAISKYLPTRFQQEEE